MKWFHLSNSKNIKKIARTNYGASDECIIPRIPEWIFKLKEDDLYREPEQPPRICVAPSVWQCVSGLGRAYDDGIPKGRMYAYEISIAEVTNRTFESPETPITDEHWIVDEVIDENTEIKIIGWMEIESVFVEMKRFTNYKTRDLMKELDEWEAVWDKGNKIENLYELILKKEHLKEVLT